jgi:hypothetical protein
MSGTVLQNGFASRSGRRLNLPGLSTPVVAAVVSALMLFAIAAVSVPAPVSGATVIKLAACPANLRTSASLSASIRASITSGTKVSVAATVSGGSWRASCAGRVVSGTSWYRISAVNGRSVASIYGRTYLYAATGLFKPVPFTRYAMCTVKLRTSASVSALSKTRIGADTRVTVVTSVAGGRWSQTCAGHALSGATWYRISAVNGKSVRTLYGVTYLYAPSRLFQSTATSSVAPAPTPTPTPIPMTGGVSLADYGGNWAAAIDAAKSHDNILNVPAGTWPASRIFPYAGLTIRGAGADRTFIRRSGPGVLAAGGFVHVSTSNVTISDLTLQGWPVTSGPSDDILIDGVNASGLKVLRVGLQHPQGVGLMLEGSSVGALVEDVTITDVTYRSNGYHGVGLWLYKGTNRSTFRRVTIDGVNYVGIMIDAGTTGSTDASSVNDNIFENIIVRHAARQLLPNGGGKGASIMFTGGARNTVTGYQFTDQVMGAAIAFGADQSGIGSTQNVLRNGTVLRITSGDIIGFSGGATGNLLDGGSGGGHVVGSYGGNTIRNWPGLIY